MNAGGDYQPEESLHFGRVFLEAQVQPYTRIRTERIGVHNVIDLSALLPVMGDQILQATLKHRGEAFAHYIVKTDAEKVHYLDISAEPHAGATVSVELNLEDLALVDGQLGKLAARMAARAVRKSSIRSLARTGLALFSAFLDHRDRNAKDRRDKGQWPGNGDGHGPMMRLPEDFSEAYAAADGWDPEEYSRIRK